MTTVKEFNCIFCKDSFDDKEALQTHFRKHGDPNFKFNQSKAQSIQYAGEKSKNENEMVGCDVCSEVFPSISKAITHKHKVHPDHDAKYFCPWCGKLFTLRHLYNKHIQATHVDDVDTHDKQFRCDACNVDFHGAAAMLYHNKFFHRQDTDIPSFGNSKKLKMHNQDVLLVYYCCFCGEEYVNKVNLHKHTIDDHSDENQSPDEVLRCPLCDAIFYHLDAYEIHLTYHSVEDLYREKNELISDIIDFSLEAVPPAIEKVENSDPQQDAETTMVEMSLEDVLLMAEDNSNEHSSKKSKKHKKHKKSKKSAITLDEFLNMNTDVFGEGLDVQGIEEVPTRVVTKDLKVYKKPQKTNLKMTPELEKLKKQGIIVKKKLEEGVKLPLKIYKNALLDKTKSNTSTESKLSSSSEVLSKLLSQSNNQIQIVKKSNQDNVNVDNTVCKETSDKTAEVTGNESMECDSTKKDLGEFTSQSSNPTRVEDFKYADYNRTEENANFNDKYTCQDSQDTFKSKSECPSPLVNISKDTNLNDSITNSEFGTDKYNETFNSNNISTACLNEVNLQRVASTLQKIKQTQGKGISSKADESDICDDNFKDQSGDVETPFEDEETTMKPVKDPSMIKEPLSTLKHLSHLITVKPVHQMKIALKNEHNSYNNELSQIDDDTGKKSSDDSITSTDDQKNIKKENQIKESVIGHLKVLGKNITFKRIPRNIHDKTNSDECDYSDSDAEGEKYVTDTLTPGTATEFVNTSVVARNIDDDNTDQQEFKKGNIKETIDTYSSSTNILKHLTNITTKPLNITTSPNKIIPSNPSSPLVVNKNIPQTIRRVETNEDNVEILHIDDSDSDDMDKAEHNIDSKTSMIPLKHAQKTITVKTKTHQNSDNNINIIKKGFTTNIQDNVSKSSPIQKSSAPNLANATLINQKYTDGTNVALNNVLKSLGKNITVKSNSSTNYNIKNQEQNLDNEHKDNNDTDSDNDSCSGKVKITEMEEDYASDEDAKTMQSNQNMIIQTPENSCSENEGNIQENHSDQDSDFESKIKVNTVAKFDENVQKFKATSFNTLKNFGNEITVKSLNNNTYKEGPSISDTNNPNTSSKPMGSLPVKPNRPNIKDQQEIKSKTNIGQIVEQKLSHSAKTMASSSNQVNKEVTVKTFQTQTKTVIQEITTTVTKTIKTVNQTVSEDVRNTCQSTSTPMMPQRIQGLRVLNQHPRILQGIPVRHANPTGSGPRVRNITPIRPTGIGTTGTCNQLVPVSSLRMPKTVRPRTNVARLSTPRMPSQKIVRPPIANTQNPKFGKPLKVSPNAVITSANKRPNTEEQTGPFSFFKKSKESQMLDLDIPVPSNSEMKTEFSSSMQTSKSNFASATKTVKGNSMVTSSQMRTEMSATSSQQFSKVSSMSGMKVVKTSQNKQIQEANESGNMNRTTLEAIEKLQKQGLLVKKPRLDQNEECEHSDPDCDDNMEYNSADEYND